MPPQTLRSDIVLSASWCRAVLQIHVGIFEQVGSQLQTPLFQKVSLCAAHGTICAFITKNPAAPASACPAKCPLGAAPKTEFILGDKTMVLFMFRLVFF